MKQLNEIVAENLAALRKSRHLTQQELAEQIGYSDKSLSKWELGKAIPTVDILKRLADFYGVSVDSLITENGALTKTTSPQDARNRSNQIVITSMAATFILFVAVVIFVNSVVTGKGVAQAWIAFIWAVPLAALVCSVLSRFFWGRGNTTTVALSSIGVWTLCLAFFLHFLLINDPSQNLWFVFLVGAPVQVMIILFAQLK
jgi:transcriptional regulator with XRE-family HTH domain